MENMFSKNLDYILKTRKFTTQQILKITGHNSKSLISMWKSGERFITTEDAVKLANALGCTIDDLINYYPFRYQVYDIKDLSKVDSSDTVVVNATVETNANVFYIRKTN